MGTKKDESILIYGAGVLVKQVDALRQEIDGVRNGEDIEYVHRMRVASRRLRNAFALFSPALPQKRLTAWQSHIKMVTKALGAARDTDVQIDLLNKFYSKLPKPELKTGIHRLIVRLNQKRTLLQQKVAVDLDILEASQILKEMGQRLTLIAARDNQESGYSPVLYQHSSQSITSRLDDFLSYESFVEKPECLTELHAMRIAAKHLRYTLETFAPLYPENMKDLIQIMRQFQDELGEIHDCDVWNDYLPNFIERERQRTLKYYGNARAMKHITPGLKYFLHDRQESRQRHYLSFVELWKKNVTASTWSKLRGTIQEPLTPNSSPPVEEITILEL